ncbi:hypothetical protein Gotri_004366, partial [Gossypium trilobum]|nr:hypothetical protein [Gossypium trilobum]
DLVVIEDGFQQLSLQDKEEVKLEIGERLINFNAMKQLYFRSGDLSRVQVSNKLVMGVHKLPSEFAFKSLAKNLGNLMGTFLDYDTSNRCNFLD